MQRTPLRGDTLDEATPHASVPMRSTPRPAPCDRRKGRRCPTKGRPTPNETAPCAQRKGVGRTPVEPSTSSPLPRAVLGESARALPRAPTGLKYVLSARGKGKRSFRQRQRTHEGQRQEQDQKAHLKQHRSVGGIFDSPWGMVTLRHPGML